MRKNQTILLVLTLVAMMAAIGSGLLFRYSPVFGVGVAAVAGLLLNVRDGFLIRHLPKR